MADCLQKIKNANSVKMGTLTVQTVGGRSVNSFAYNTTATQTDPDGESPAFWEAKLTNRFTHGDFKTEVA